MIMPIAFLSSFLFTTSSYSSSLVCARESAFVKVSWDLGWILVSDIRYLLSYGMFPKGLLHDHRIFHNANVTPTRVLTTTRLEATRGNGVNRASLVDP